MNIKNIIYFIVCVAAFMTIYVAFSRILPPDKETELKRSGVIRTKHYEAISMGNSHAVALRLELMGFENVYYLWDDGSDLYDSFVTYKYLSDKDIKTDCLFISIAPGAELLDNGQLRMKERKRQQSFYYFGGNRFAFADFRNYLKSLFLPVVRPDHGRSVWRAMLNQPSDSTVIIDDKGFLLGRRNNVNLIDLFRADSLSVQRVRNVTNTYLLLNTGKSKKFNSRVVDWGLEMCRKNNTEVIFYTPPYYSKFSQLLKNELKSTRQFISFFQEKYPNVSYYDFSNDTLFTNHFEYFTNPDHLNVYGARRFSLRFKNLLQDI